MHGVPMTLGSALGLRGLGFRGLGLGVQGSGFIRVQGLTPWDLGYGKYRISVGEVYVY